MKRSTTAALALAAALTVGSCAGSSPSAAEQAAAELATDLGSGSFDSGVVLDPTQAEIWYAYALGPLIDARREVEVGDVVVDGESAEVSLTWTISVPDGEFTAPAHATLQRREGEWRLDWVPSVLHLAATETSEYALTVDGESVRVVLSDAVDDGGGTPGELLVAVLGGASQNR